MFGSALPAQKGRSVLQPNQFVIGRHTFFDFGPPFDFYELFIVNPEGVGSSIKRVTIVPSGDMCISPPKIKLESKTIGEIPAVLFGATNPCSIPEKELKGELKRCKNCLVFSGAKVVMQVQCGTETRLIRSDILDRDMFDKSPKTPKNTSWTMALLQKMDSEVGPGAIDTSRIFPVAGPDKPTADFSDSAVLNEIGIGKYDTLFQTAPDKPSDLYHASKTLPPQPAVQLRPGLTIQPESFVLPAYPVMHDLVTKLGEARFNLDFERDFTPNDKFGGAVMRLPGLFDSAAITTNFDRVLEMAYERSGKAFIEKTTGRGPVNAFYRAIPAGERYLLKLHGNLDNTAERVLNKSEYDAAYGNDGNIHFDFPVPKLLKRLYTSFSFLFLGSSLSYDRTIQTFTKVAQDVGADSLPHHYAILGHPSDVGKRSKLEQRLADAHISAIWFPGGEYQYIEEMLELLLV
jgi:hypothetical protein